MIACAMKHHGRIDPSLSRVTIQRFGDHGLNVPVICLACDEAPCIKVCPMNARIRQENGTVVTDTDVCIGCRACTYMCPVASPRINPYTNQTLTCDMCAGEEEPWCVAACRKERALTLCREGSAASRTARESARKIRSIYPAR